MSLPILIHGLLFAVYFKLLYHYKRGQFKEELAERLRITYELNMSEEDDAINNAE